MIPSIQLARLMRKKLPMNECLLTYTNINNPDKVWRAFVMIFAKYWLIVQDSVATQFYF